MSQQDVGESIDKLRESIYCNFNLLNLPEFRGLPGENIDKFLHDFSRATTTFTPERKCLAIKRSLTGDAGFFAKSYLKPDLVTGKWKEVKEALRNRFSPIDRELMSRTELRNMVYNKDTATLLGYVDRYANLYRKVHPKAEDRELIGDLALNLGAELVRKLNQISPGWQSTVTFESFRALISRLEKDILAYESTKSVTPAEIMNVVNKTVLAAIEEPMKDIRNLIESAAKKPDEAVEKTLAAIHHSQGYRGARRHFKRKDRDWDDRTSKSNQRPKHSGEVNDRNDKTSRLQDLKKKYEDNFGRLNGECFTCGGFHFKRHCPLENIDALKE